MTAPGRGVGRLKKRPEFLAVAGTRRKHVTPGLILQVRRHDDRQRPAPGEPPIRVGLTASRKVGNAVVRNRARRRLREAARAVETRPLRGHVTRAVGTMIHAVVPGVRVGELCRLEDGRGGLALEAEVVGLAGETALLTPIGGIEGLSGRVEVVPTGRMVEVPVGESLLGRILDGRGRPLDGGAARGAKSAARATRSLPSARRIPALGRHRRAVARGLR